MSRPVHGLFERPGHEVFILTHGFVLKQDIELNKWLGLYFLLVSLQTDLKRAPTPKTDALLAGALRISGRGAREAPEEAGPEGCGDSSGRRGDAEAPGQLFFSTVLVYTRIQYIARKDVDRWIDR